MNRIARLILVASAASSSVMGAVAHAQGTARPTVAILYFNSGVVASDARNYDGLSKGIADFLATEMATNPAIRVIERDQVQKLLDAQRRVTSGPIDRETAVLVGRLLGAQHMIFGGFMTDSRGNIRIDARAVNVETGMIEFTHRAQDNADHLTPLIAQLADRLTAGLKLPGAMVRATAGAAPATLPMRDAVMYGRALDLADKGERARALELLDDILRRFPEFGPARALVSKLKSRG